MRWNTPRSNGWIGSTTAASSSQSVMCHQWSSKRSTIVSNPVWPSRPDLNPELSGDPGAIQYLAASETRRTYVLFNRKGDALEPVIALWRYSLKPLLEQYLSGADSTERDKLIETIADVMLNGEKK